MARYLAWICLHVLRNPMGTQDSHLGGSQGPPAREPFTTNRISYLTSHVQMKKARRKEGNSSLSYVRVMNTGHILPDTLWEGCCSLEGP